MPVLIRTIDTLQDIFIVGGMTECLPDSLRKYCVGITDDYASLDIKSLETDEKVSIETEGYFAVLTKEEFVSIIPEMKRADSYFEQLGVNDVSGLPDYADKYGGDKYHMVIAACIGEIRMTWEEEGVCLLNNYNPEVDDYMLHHLDDAPKSNLPSWILAQQRRKDINGLIVDKGTPMKVALYKLIDRATDAQHLLDYSDRTTKEEVKEALLEQLSFPQPIHLDFNTLKMVASFQEFLTYLVGKYPNKYYEYSELRNYYELSATTADHTPKEDFYQLIDDFADFVVSMPSYVKHFNIWYKWLLREPELTGRP